MHWKEEEIKFLKENYSKERSLTKLSQVLKKSIKAINHKAAREGLSRPRFPFSNPLNRTPRNVIDKVYYEKNKELIYLRKKKRYNNRKLELISLKGGKCEKCGYHRSAAALDFHHKSNDKEGNIARLLKDVSKQQVLKEVDKCILLCSNCHREIHSGA